MSARRERMIEFLYGELQGEELRAFEQRLRESEDDRRELAALQATLGSVREGLAHSANEAPPARVRRALLAAAAAHAPRARTPRWLRTSFVVVPALAVAAAALLIVLGKKIEAPRVHVDPAEARSQLEPSAPPPSAAAPEPAKTGAPSPEGTAQSEAEAPASGSARSSATGSARARAAAPPSAAMREDEARARPASSGAAPASKPASTPGASFAQPPPAWTRDGQQPSAAKRRAQPEADERDSSNTSQPARVAPADKAREQKAERAPVAPSAPANEAQVERAPKGSAADDLSVGSVGAAEPAASAARMRSANAAAISFPASANELERRARDSFNAKRWQEASRDYRELLRRYPTSARAPAWKKQLTLATRAEPAPSP